MAHVIDKVTGKTIGNYQRMVEFINYICSKHTCCLCAPECCIRCDARKLLIEIGELKREET